MEIEIPFKLLSNFATTFSQSVKLETLNFDGRNLTVELSDQVVKSDYIVLLNQIFNSVTELLNDKVEVQIDKCLLPDCKVFFEQENYFARYTEYKDSFNEIIVLVIHKGGSFFLKDIHEIFNKANALLFNFVTYHKIISFLRENPLFTTLYNETNKQLIIVSKDNGVFHLGFNFNEARVKDLDDLNPKLDELKLLFLKKEFIQFFKEVITNAGIHEKDVNDRLFEVIKNLKILLSLTEKDYDSYVLDFAFDKIKSKFKEERNKYFESLEKNIETVSKQILSFPLTFAATVFASYQVKDKPVILLFIVIGYGLYTLLAFKILSIVKYNISCLTTDVDKEENEIRNSYNKIYKDFKGDFEKVRTKINKLEGLMFWLKSILVALLLAFAFYSLFQISNVSDNTPKQNIIVKTNVVNVNVGKDSIRHQTNSPSKDTVMNSGRLNDSSKNSKVGHILPH